MPGHAGRERPPAGIGDCGRFRLARFVRDDRRPVAGEAHGAGRHPSRVRRRAQRVLGERNNRRRAAVVVGQRDGFSAGKDLAELAEGRGVRPREPVDRLGGIAHDGEVAPIAQPRPEKADLQRRCVLELVNEEVAEAPALAGGELVVARDAVGAAAEHVVEVEQSSLALLGLVAGVQLGELGARSRETPGNSPRGIGELVGGHQPGLRPFDLRCNLVDCNRGRRAPSAEQRPQQAGLAVEHPRLFPPSFGRLPAQLGERDRVEGAAGQRALDTEPAQAPHELGGRSARERQRQYVLGLGRVLAYPERHAAGQHACLARAGWGDDCEQRMRRDDGRPLLRVQVVEQGVAHDGDGTEHLRHFAGSAHDARDKGHAERPRVVFAASQLRSSRGPLRSDVPLKAALASALHRLRQFTLRPESRRATGKLVHPFRAYPGWDVARSPTHRRTGLRTLRPRSLIVKRSHHCDRSSRTACSTCRSNAI